MPRTVLIVDDNKMNRIFLKNVLSKEYTVIEACDGEDALSALKKNYKHISAIMLDIMMPVMDGYELLEKLRSNPAYSQIPVIVTTGNTEEGSEVKALALGANDFVKKPYDPAIVLHRLHNTIHLRETSATVNALSRDRLTNLFNRDSFFERAANLISLHEPGYYVLSCFDVDGFKAINDQHGTEVGDKVLRYIANQFRAGFEPVGGICCRIMADNYAVLYPSMYVDTPVTQKIGEAISTIPALGLSIGFSIGRYIINDKKLPVNAMYDRAAMAMETVKGRYDVHVALYSEDMRAQLLKEQEIVNEMKPALAGGQFEVWFQPQYNHSTKARVGAEALVRWRHPVKGLISPGIFIPVFERNGFVYEVDKFVWEQVCVMLRNWIDTGYSPLPVSVNVSRYDVFRDDLVDVLSGLVSKYKIPIDMLRLEITESAFAKSAEQIIRVVKRLIEAGFTIEIDDFGSGYSSLNTLKDVPATILKLDMRFLESDENSERGGNILESIVRMAKWLGMSVIAEGVEKKEQADFLTSIGCNYIQGYYYSRPLPAHEYELLATTPKEETLAALETVEMLDNNTFWDPASMDTLIFNSYVGGACIFEYFGGHIDVLRANRKFARMLGGEGFSVESALKLKWGEHLDPDATADGKNAIKQAIRTGEEVAYETAIIGLGIPVAYVHVTMRAIARTGDRHLIYCTIENLTAQRLAERREHETAEQLRTIMENMNGGVSAITFDGEGHSHFIFANEQYFKILGYESQRQLTDEVKDILELVDPDDLPHTMRAISRVLTTHQPARYDYRCKRRDGSTINVHCSASATTMEGIRDTILLSVMTDESELVAAQQEVAQTTSHLQAIMQNINGGVTACTVNDNDSVRFIFSNEQYYAQLGYTKEQFFAEVKTPFDLIYPQDRKRVSERTRRASVAGKPLSIIYRAVKRDGDIVWLQSNISITEIKGISQPVQISVANDITARVLAERSQRRLSKQLGAIMQNINGGVLASTHSKGPAQLVFANDKFYSMFGYTAEQFAAELPRGIDERILPEDVQEVSARFVREKGDEFVLEPIEFRVRKRDQSVIWVSCNGSACRLEGIDELVYVTILNDITREKEAAQELERSAERIRVLNESLIDLMNDTPGGFSRIQLLDCGEATCLYVNTVYCKLVGFTHDELAPQLLADAYWGIHSEDAPVIKGAIADMDQNGQSRNIKIRIRHKNGQYTWFIVFMRLTQNESGERFINAYFADLSEQLRKEEQQKELLDNLPCGAALLELEGDDKRVVYLNKRYNELVGRNASKTPDASLVRAVRPDDIKRLMAEVKAAINEKRDIACDVHLRYGESGYRPFRAAARIIQREGMPMSIYATFTQMNDGEMSLPETLPFLLDAMMESSNDLTFAKNRELIYICCSKPFARMVGLASPTDVVGKTDFDLFPREEAERIRQSDIELLASGKPVLNQTDLFEFEDGSQHYSSTSKFVLRDTLGNAIGVYGIGHDVTEYRTAFEQLRILAESIPGGLALFEMSAGHVNMLYYNDGFYRYSGYTHDEYAEISAKDEFGILFESDRQKVIEALDDLYTGRTAVAGCEYRCRTKSGALRWFRMKGRLSERRGNAAIIGIVQLDITDQHESEEKLRVSEEQFRLAASLCDRIVARYDIAAGVYYNNNDVLSGMGFGGIIEDVPQAFIEKGLINPASVDDIMRFFRSIADGQSPVNTTALMKGENGDFRWFDISSNTSFDQSGKPTEAVIVFSDVTEQREKETVYLKWKQSLQQLDEASYTLFRCNISKNATFDSREGRLLDVKFSGDSDAFNDRTLEYADQYVFADDRAKYLALVNSDALLAGYYRGKRKHTLEYRENSGGGVRWLKLTIDLVEYPDTSDIEAYMMYESIDARKQAELAADEQLRRDPLTGVLNRKAFQERMTQLLQNATESSRHAMLLMDIDGFKMVNDFYGHAMGDQALKDIAESLGSVLGDDDILGRLGGDEFLVCIKDARNEEAVINKIKQICALVRRTFGLEVQISASIGAVLCPQDGSDYEALYKKADKALYYVKGSGKDGYAFYSDEMEEDAASFTHGAEKYQAALQSGEKIRRMLIVDDNDMSRTFLFGIFKNDFNIETAKNGSEALIRLHRFGSSLSVVLLDLIMPGLDGFDVLSKMRSSAEMQNIPVIVVSGSNERETSLKAIRAGASDFVTKPIDSDLIKLRVQSAISKSENERLRVQNSLLMLQKSEFAKYQAVVEGRGTIIIQLNWVEGTFIYDALISKRLAGNYNGRNLWQVFLIDMVAETRDVQRMQHLVHDVADDRNRASGSLKVLLKTPDRKKKCFTMHVYKLTDAFGLTDKLIITLDDADVPEELTDV